MLSKSTFTGRTANIALIAIVVALLLTLGGTCARPRRPCSPPLCGSTPAAALLWKALVPIGSRTHRSSALGYGYVDFSGDPSQPSGSLLPGTSGTDNDLLFATGRIGMEAYVLNLPNGVYDLTLHFAKASGDVNAPGQRVIDVFVEGVHAIQSLDLYVEAGFNTALSRVVPDVRITDSQLKTVFVASAGSVELRGIQADVVEIDPTPTPSPTPGPTASGEIATVVLRVRDGATERAQLAEIAASALITDEGYVFAAPLMAVVLVPVAAIPRTPGT
jgi:hypothetical protein